MLSLQSTYTMVLCSRVAVPLDRTKHAVESLCLDDDSAWRFRGERERLNVLSAFPLCSAVALSFPST